MGFRPCPPQPRQPGRFGSGDGQQRFGFVDQQQEALAGTAKRAGDAAQNHERILPFQFAHNDAMGCEMLRRVLERHVKFHGEIATVLASLHVPEERHIGRIAGMCEKLKLAQQRRFADPPRTDNPQGGVGRITQIGKQMSLIHISEPTRPY